jgi:hypothetical protein
MFKPPQLSTLRVVPPEPPLLTAPQLPVGSPVVKANTVGSDVEVVVVVTMMVVEVLVVDGSDVLVDVLVVEAIVIDVVLDATVVLVLVDSSVVEVVDDGVVVLVVVSPGHCE